MKKYRVILENINRNDGCRSGAPIIERDFDSASEARACYDGIEIKGWFHTMTDYEKKKMYLEKGLYTFEVEKDEDGEEYEVEDSLEYKDYDTAGYYAEFEVTYKVLTEDELNNEGADSKGWGYLLDTVKEDSAGNLEYDATNEFEESWEDGALEDAQGNPLTLGKKSKSSWKELDDGDTYEQWVTYTDENGYKIYLIQRAKEKELF